MAEAQGREALRGPRGSSGRPCPNRDHPRPPHKKTPPAHRRNAPARLSCLQNPPPCLKRVGAVRARAVGCLTEPGIVCFPAVERSTQESINKAQGRETLRGRRRSSDRPCPNCDHPRSPHKKTPPAHRRNAPARLSCLQNPPPCLKRVGAVRAKAAGCLTESGIVCFPAVERSTQESINKAQGRETLRGRRRSSDRPCPNCDHPR